MNEIDGFIAQLSELVKKLQQDALFRRDREIFEWALEYPWVTEQACDPVNYHFSYKANRFENTLLQFSHPDGKIQGLMWIILHNSVLSVPYFFAGDPALEACMAESIVRTMIEKECTHEGPQEDISQYTEDATADFCSPDPKGTAARKTDHS